MTVTADNFFNNSKEDNDWQILSRYERNTAQEEKKIVELKYYDDKILKYLPTPKIGCWLEEGITQEVMDAAGIKFNPINWAIVIPHYTMDNKLLGIRERTLIKENEEFGKYKPAILNYQMYNHPLGFNLYNLNNSKDNIRKIKKAIIF